MRYICVIGLLFCLVFGYSQEQYKFRVWLTDKKDTAFSLEKPERILSSKALARRARFGILIDVCGTAENGRIPCDYTVEVAEYCSCFSIGQ